MNNGSPTTQLYAIPLKRCSGSVIDHSLVTVNLSLEWVPKCGDDPNLIIEIISKSPPTPPLPQDSPPTASNSLQQPQVYHQLNLNTYPDMNTDLIHTTTSADQSDLHATTTTTTTIVRNTRPPSPLAIQQIKADLKSHLAPLLTQQTNFSEPNGIEETGFEPHHPPPIPMPSNPYCDFQQPSPIRIPSTLPNYFPNRPLVCACPHPPNQHLHTCAVHCLHNQELHPNASYNHPHLMNHASFAPPSQAYDASSITTIISPTSSYLTNPTLNSTLHLPTTHFPPPTWNVSQVIINSQPNFQTNSIIAPQQIIPKPKKKTRGRRKSAAKQELILTPNSNSIEQLSPPYTNPTSLIQSADNPPSATGLQTSSIRSPVALDGLLAQTIDEEQKKSDHAAEEIINRVAGGQGDITTKTSRKPSSSSHTKRTRSTSRDKSAGKHFLHSPINSQQPDANAIDTNEPSLSLFESITPRQNEVHLIRADTDHRIVLDEIYSTRHDTIFTSLELLTPIPTHSTLDELLPEDFLDKPDCELDFQPTSSISTPRDVLPAAYSSQTQSFPEDNRQSQVRLLSDAQF